MMRSFVAIFVLLAASHVYGADLAGDYAGTWSSTTVSASGKLRLGIQKNVQGWTCKLAYLTPEGGEVIAQHLSCAVNGSQLTGQYEVADPGGTSRIALKAVRTGKSITGTYNETGPDGRATDAGTWSVALGR